jgi:squalene-associated FAD-dependent desaturase
MKRVIVIGGGFAGLTAAAYLSNSGNKVKLIEASPKLGGRAYSLTDEVTGSVVDNGQHILMGCYKETLKFLRLIDADKNFIFQERLKVNYLNRTGKLFRLEATNIFYPFNLFFGLLNFEALNFINRLILLKFFLKLYFYSDEELKKLTVYQWLLLEEQNEEIRKTFWDFLAIGALNTNTKKASAKVFADILKEIFFKGNEAATIILPAKGLTESYCNEAQKFIEKKDGEINLSEQVTGFELLNDKINKVTTSKRTLSDFDYVISSIPWFALEKIETSEVSESNTMSKPRRLQDEIDLNFEHSAILTIHIWLKENKLDEDFYGLIDSPVHWVFNHNDHITLVSSDANTLIDKSKEELFEIAAAELKKYTGIEKEEIKSYKVIKEKRSTFVPDNESLEKRPVTKTGIKNFYLAGDWINTGLPSTIESAAKSGRMAAIEIMRE